MDASLKAKFQDLTSRDFAAQAKWFLNGFWELHGKDAETIWEQVNICILLDTKNGKAGNELDEFQAHRFLEQLGETLTVADMRAKLKEIDVDFNKRMALIEYLIFKFKKGVPEVVNAHQGGVETRKKIAEAESLVTKASLALDELSQRLEEQKQALAYQKVATAEALRAEADARNAESDALSSESEARSREAAATSREDEAKTREASASAREEEARRADEENKAALADLQSQEDAFTKKKNDLLAASQNESTGQVSRNRAKNELEQLKSTDPLPLQRAKLNQSATVRKFERAHLDAESARNVAEQAREEASSARADAVRTRKEAEKAREDATQAVKDAEKAREKQEKCAYDAEVAVQATAIATEDANRKLAEASEALEELKKQPDQSFGDIWWMERELTERKKYLPKSKQ